MKTLNRLPYPSLVAQIFNLLYRRFAIGRATRSSGAFKCLEGPQNAILLYGRLQVCATCAAGSPGTFALLLALLLLLVLSHPLAAQTVHQFSGIKGLAR
ncbi:MAG: hypothetical protein HY735_26180 [Verrucomicrobia bacterium]|nr:hypothetical protein [Verrucomicrobiota bacterium]